MRLGGDIAGAVRTRRVNGRKTVYSTILVKQGKAWNRY
jgi:hypothetical protein